MKIGKLWAGILQEDPVPAASTDIPEETSEGKVKGKEHRETMWLKSWIATTIHGLVMDWVITELHSGWHLDLGNHIELIFPRIEILQRSREACCFSVDSDWSGGRFGCQ